MTESQFPNTNDWKRKALIIGEIPIVFHDHRDTPGAKGAVTLEEGAVARANVADVDFKALVLLPRTVLAANPERAVVHINTSRGEFLQAACPNQPEQNRAIILQVTTQTSGLTDEHDPGSAVVWFSMKDRSAYEKAADWLTEFLKLDFTQASDLAKFKTRAAASGWESANPGFDHFLDIILPGRVENWLAFRLLCEAKQVCGAAPTKELFGITINAPVTIEQWLQPFGRSRPDEISETANLIGGGEVGKKAKAVLDAANSKGDISTAIREFLEISAKIERP